MILKSPRFIPFMSNLTKFRANPDICVSHLSPAGTRKHPPCGLSVDKSREFRQALDHEVSRILTDQEMTQNGRSPSWSLVVHRQPSFSDESPLITQSFLAASKVDFTPSYFLHIGHWPKIDFKLSYLYILTQVYEPGFPQMGTKGNIRHEDIYWLKLKIL